ncbi:hypothetical protein VTO73DRAFT_15603 [Trametes versicolor]
MQARTIREHLDILAFNPERPRITGHFLARLPRRIREGTEDRCKRHIRLPPPFGQREPVRAAILGRIPFRLELFNHFLRRARTSFLCAYVILLCRQYHIPNTFKRALGSDVFDEAATAFARITSATRAHLGLASVILR